MKQNKLPSLVSVLILTLLTSIMWVSFNIYRALTTKPAPAVPQEISRPLTPTLDEATIDQIESRLFLDDSQIPENIITVLEPEATSLPLTTPLPSPTPISTPTASPEAEIIQ